MGAKNCLIGIAAVLSLLRAGSAHAQTTGQGSLAFGIGRYSNGYSGGRVAQFGGGGEAIGHGVGIGGDALFTAGGSDAFLESSFMVRYHFPRAGAARRIEPFAGAGYTLLSPLTEFGGISSCTMGGGLTYWLGREGLRFELRQVVLVQGYSTRYWTARIGLSFR